VVLAQDAAAARQDVFVELHLGPAVITSHPRIVAPAARACQAPAIDELFGVIQRLLVPQRCCAACRVMPSR
jgi:hypothetical protein